MTAANLIHRWMVRTIFIPLGSRFSEAMRCGRQSAHCPGQRPGGGGAPPLFSSPCLPHCLV